MSFDLDTPGAKERRIHELVRLRDVAAVLPIDTLVDVVGRGEIAADGAERIRDVEYVIVLDADAYEALRHLSQIPSSRERTPRGPEPGVGASALARHAETWGERAEAFERNAKGESASGQIDPCARRLGLMCRQAEGEFEGLAMRAAGGEDAPAEREAA